MLIYYLSVGSQKTARQAQSKPQPWDLPTVRPYMSHCGGVPQFPI